MTKQIACMGKTKEDHNEDQEMKVHVPTYKQSYK